MDACGKTPDPAVVEATKKLKTRIRFGGRLRTPKMDLTDAETMENAGGKTGSDDDKLEEKYWRAEDFVAKASMDEPLASGLLTRMESSTTMLRKTHWFVAGGELEKQAEAEATEEALDSLLAHGVVEDTNREGATTFKSLTTRWDKGCQVKDGEWKMIVQFVGQEHKWAEHRKDLFSPGATPPLRHVKDFSAWKMGLETFEADAVDAHYQPPEFGASVPRTLRQSWKRPRHCVAITGARKTSSK